MHPNVSERIQTGPNTSESFEQKCEDIEQLCENVENVHETAKLFPVTSNAVPLLFLLLAPRSRQLTSSLPWWSPVPGSQRAKSDFIPEQEPVGTTGDGNDFASLANIRRQGPNASEIFDNLAQTSKNFVDASKMFVKLAK